MKLYISIYYIAKLYFLFTLSLCTSAIRVMLENVRICNGTCGISQVLKYLGKCLVLSLRYTSIKNLLCHHFFKRIRSWLLQYITWTVVLSGFTLKKECHKCVWFGFDIPPKYQNLYIFFNKNMCYLKKKQKQKVIQTRCVICQIIEKSCLVSVNKKKYSVWKRV